MMLKVNLFDPGNRHDKDVIAIDMLRVESVQLSERYVGKSTFITIALLTMASGSKFEVYEGQWVFDRITAAHQEPQA